MLVGGKGTHKGHIVHYTDHAGDKHAALIKNIQPTATGHQADLQVYHATNGSDNHVEAVSHSVNAMPHTWAHIPED